VTQTYLSRPYNEMIPWMICVAHCGSPCPKFCRWKIIQYGYPSHMHWVYKMY